MIAERCSVELRPETVFPKLPEEHDLRCLAFAGARERYGKLDQEITARLEYELDVIEEMGFSDYFLIVWDIVRFAKEAQTLWGPEEAPLGVWWRTAWGLPTWIQLPTSCF